MSQTLFSPSWYRVAQLRPRLRGHAAVHRHQYRGEVWFVLEDRSTGKFYRFTPNTQEFIGRMDGRRTVQELWDTTSERLGDDSLTQDEVIQLMGQLHASNVLLCDVPPDTEELLRRAKRIDRAQWLQRLRSPLAIRVPLLDPDRFLARTAAVVRPLFSPLAGIAWLAFVLSAVVVAGVHWPELTENLADRVLSAKSLAVSALVYPLVKALHELGHGYAVKAWGGEVHEMGIIFLVFVPIPYVDASAASEFRSKNRRMVVGAAGMIVELALAAAAVFLWIDMQPGFARSIVFNVIVIGSLSTLLFNGNPLLRYDGYYVLSDLLEIPNLSQRGNAFLAWLVQRHAFGVERAQRPHVAPGEPFWFVAYTIGAFVYRLFIYAAIILFLASKLFMIGVLLAVWAAFSMVAMPLGKGVKFVLTNPALRDTRGRAVIVSVAAVAVAGLLLFLVPFPLRTQAEGVVWAPDDSLVRAGTNGFVDRVVAAPGERIERGRPIVVCSDPLLRANADVARARVEEMQSRYDAVRPTDHVQAQLFEKELTDARVELARVEERLEALEIRSPSAGLLVLPDAADLPNHYLAQGDLIGFVLDVERPTLRVVVPQSRVDLVRQQTREVLVRPAERLDWILSAVVKREVPEAEERLPSTILGTGGGGAIAIDPREESGTKAFEKMFQFDVQLTQPPGRVFVGGRVHVRFDHGYEPVGFQLFRAARQIFLRRFAI